MPNSRMVKIVVKGMSNYARDLRKNGKDSYKKREVADILEMYAKRIRSAIKVEARNIGKA